jgi:DtxR family Mn-dependent transcriptional regulator
MTEKISATIEDYLGFMYILERDGQPVVGVHLAELLGVTPPTVTNTLKRMVRDGLVTLGEEGGPCLTPQGRQAAATVLRRHMLAEWMLTHMISWSRLHHEAHELEHAISDDVEAALLKELNSPEVCPHGNPLPGHEIVAANWVPLTKLPVGSFAIIRRIHELAEDDRQIMAFLESKKLSPGQEVMVKELLPFNETVTIHVGNELVSLGFAVARYIFGEVIDAPAV